MLKMQRCADGSWPENQKRSRDPEMVNDKNKDVSWTEFLSTRSVEPGSLSNLERCTWNQRLGYISQCSFRYTYFCSMHIIVLPARM